MEHVIGDSYNSTNLLRLQSCFVLGRPDCCFGAGGSLVTPSFQLFPNRPGRHFLEGALHKLKCVVGVYQVHKNIGELFFFPFSEDCTCMATGVQKVLPDTTTAPLEVWLHNVMRSCPPFPVTSNTSSESSTTNEGSLKSPHQPPTQAQSSMQLHPTFF
jgi:hypothetical protein